MPHTPSLIDLQPACDKCAAFCCVALAFDKSDMFGMDKQAGVACTHLDSAHKCTIHPKLAEKGFAGCVRYNCFGAGQRVTQELYDGRSWHDHPHEADDMFDAFRVIHKIHEHLAMLDATRKLPLDATQRRQIERFEQALTPINKWMPEDARQLTQTAIFDEMATFFRGLHDRV